MSQARHSPGFPPLASWPLFYLCAVPARGSRSSQGRNGFSGTCPCPTQPSTLRLWLL